MSARHTGRRPNRRQLDRSLINVAPLALQWLNPTINGNNTVFEGGVTQAMARVATQAATPEVERITCTGVFGGLWQTLPALEIGNEGESAGGTLLQITFDQILSLEDPWELAIPSDTPLVQSRYGGRLTGTYYNGQATASADGGYIRQTNLMPGPTGVPVLMWLVTATFVDSTHIQVETNSSGNSPFVFDGVPAINDSIAGAATGIADDTGGFFTLTFPGGVAPGTTLSGPAWDGAIRGQSGEWLAPFVTTVLP